MDCGGKCLNVDRLALGAAGVPGAQVLMHVPEAGGDAFEHQIGPESASGPTTISSTLET